MKYRIAIVGLVSMVIVGVCVMRWASQPVVSNPNPAQKTAVQGVQEVAPSNLESPYFITKLAGNLKVSSDNLEPTTPISQQIVALASDGRSSDQLAITIGKIPQNGLNELSAVQLRERNPKIYQRVEIAGMPIEATVFRSVAQEYEMAVFWPYVDRYAAIVTSGLNADQERLDGQLMITVNNWQWH